MQTKKLDRIILFKQLLLQNEATLTILNKKMLKYKFNFPEMTGEFI